mgnify:CR=1 FL=1
MEKAQKLFDPIWEDYLKQNPHVKKIYELFTDLGERVVNDHIAFRTYNDPRINIDVLAQQFIEAGYEFKGEYQFEQKKLYAKHFELAGFKDAPRIFISELKLEEMSPFLRKTVNALIDQIPTNLLNSPELIFKGRVWEKPSYSIYEKLRQESEYASWLYVFGFRANHFTVNINALKQLDTMDKVIGFLKSNGFKMNTSGGEIKGSPESLLEQSSIIAGTIPIEFIEGIYNVPSCYYEFAKRYKDKNGDIYGGFIAKSADKIFESTDYRKN